MTVRIEDPEARLQHARDVAWKALNRRERTVAELARILAGKRVEPAAIDTVVAELQEQGYLDDASYAQRFADDRRRLDAWGAERIERKLLSLGIDRELIAAAIGEQDHTGELEAALRAARPPLPGPAADAARARPRARHARPQGLRARARIRRPAAPRGRLRRAAGLSRAARCARRAGARLRRFA